MKKFGSVMSVCITAASLVFLSGCSGTQQVKPEVNIEDNTHFVVLDESMGERIEVSNIAQRYLGDLATGIVELQSTHFLTLDVQYRFAWYDQDGFELELESKGWKPISIPPKGIITLKTTAPSSVATSFKIFVQ